MWEQKSEIASFLSILLSSVCDELWDLIFKWFCWIMRALGSSLKGRRSLFEPQVNIRNEAEAHIKIDLYRKAFLLIKQFKWEFTTFVSKELDAISRLVGMMRIPSHSRLNSRFSTRIARARIEKRDIHEWKIEFVGKVFLSSDFFPAKSKRFFKSDFMNGNERGSGREVVSVFCWRNEKTTKQRQRQKTLSFEEDLVHWARNPFSLE